MTSSPLPVTPDITDQMVEAALNAGSPSGWVSGRRSGRECIRNALEAAFPLIAGPILAEMDRLNEIIDDLAGAREVCRQLGYDLEDERAEVRVLSARLEQATEALEPVRKFVADVDAAHATRQTLPVKDAAIAIYVMGNAGKLTMGDLRKIATLASGGNSPTPAPDLAAENAVLRTLLSEARRHVYATNGAEHLFDGFGPRTKQPSDDLLKRIDAALSAPTPQEPSDSRPADAEGAE